MDLMSVFLEEGKTLHMPAKTAVFRQGDNNDNIYFINKGIIKATYISSCGKEFIKSFIVQNDVIGSIQAINGGRCSFSLETLTEVQLIKLPYHRLLSHAECSLEIANALINLLMQFGEKKERREYELLCLSAEERYRCLLEKTPNIGKFVTQNEIAKYLGITPVALSRIKRAMQLNQ